MSLHKEYDDVRSFVDMNQEDLEELSHKKRIRKMLENRLERRRLKEELEYFDGELDGEFDWDYVDK